MATDATNVSSEQPETGPANDAPLSFSEADEAIAGILGDLDEDQDPVDEPNGNEDAEETEEGAPEDEGELDPAALTEDEETDDTEEPDASDAYSGGRFASDDAKVTLDDGTVISVAELKRNNLFQRDYSKKTEEIAREREAVTKAKEEFSQVSEQLGKEREFALWFIENNIPQEPKAPTVPYATDPVAWGEYQQQVHAYNQMVAAWQQMHQGKEAESQRKQAESKAEFDKTVATERESLFRTYPKLKDDGFRAKWFEETFSGVNKEYGIPLEMLNGVTDHRIIRAMRDAYLYRKAKAQAPEVRKEVQKKPAMAQGSGKRQNPEARVARENQNVVKRLRETGSVQDADAAILRALG